LSWMTAPGITALAMFRSDSPLGRALGCEELVASVDLR
jgi:hypothetical protein